jgi:hypothetical protein
MFRFTIIFLACYSLLSSCERIGNGPSPRLLFSDDTVYFDTIFSSIGSVTKELRVINPGKHELIIDHIFLGGGKSSQFRLNIDGDPGTEEYNVRVEAGDSIFIFVDAFIDPANNNSPIEVADSIMFSLSGISFKINLLAWGQDINLIKDKMIETETWIKGKPYVIYDRVTVDTMGILTIGEGTKVFFHKNASMIIAGTLIVNGSVGSQVLFAGDRLEKMYEDIPGQWKGILILNSSKGNNIRYATIRNAIYGIQLGEAKKGSDFPVLKLFSTIIAHSTISGLSAINSNMEAANCEIIHCGSYCIYIGSGGDYTFTGCTLFNRWDYGFRLTPAFFVTEKPEKPGLPVLQMDVNINNSVIFGDYTSEIGIIPLNTIFSGNYYFDHCLIKLDTLHASFWDRDEFPGTIINKDPRFIDAGKWDLRPDTLSPLINSGNPAFSLLYPSDIRGVSRTLSGNPDIGVFERITGEHKKEK